MGVLPASFDPLADPRPARPCRRPAARTSTGPAGSSSRCGVGADVKGNSYIDRSYWNLCGPGAVAVALYYWQQLAGYPNVSGTSGYFLDPYESAGAAWPERGPGLRSAVTGSRTRLGPTGPARTR